MYHPSRSKFQALSFLVILVLGLGGRGKLAQGPIGDDSKLTSSKRREVLPSAEEEANALILEVR